MSRKMFMVILSAATLLFSMVGAFAKSPHSQVLVGAVYTMTNDAADNEVVFFDRDENGLLTKRDSISTQGTGSGGGLDPLGSQGSLVLSENNQWLLAVNAGSNEISVFRVLAKGLEFVNKTGSGGNFPVSVTVFQDLVYVLNAGTDPNITGFYLSHKGDLSPLADSTRPLGTMGGEQVGFDPKGERLVVTDKANNEILVYSVGRDGLPSMNPVISPSNGLVPFGFIFDEREHLMIVEAGSGAVSSYDILPDNSLQVITPSLASGQTAACWIARNRRGNVFTANTGSQTISSYKLMAGQGTLTLVNNVAGIGNRPIDMAVSADGRFLYALDPGDGTIDMFEIKQDGSLTGLGSAADGLSIFAQGLAAQ